MLQHVSNHDLASMRGKYEKNLAWPKNALPPTFITQLWIA